MSSPILVTGGTGTLGRHVVAKLREAGAEVRVLSRSSDGPGLLRGDLDSGAGVAEAVDGVATIVHCAGSSSGDQDKTATLVRAAARAGKPHLVHISVVGADRTPVVSRTDRRMFGYVADKRAAELVVMDSGLPWTILRATQFHELMRTVATAMAKLPVIPDPTGIRVQPVAGAEVAARLVELALGEPAGLVADFGGPRAYSFPALVGAHLAATGRRRRPRLPIRLPGRAAAAFRSGANLAAGPGRQTWEDFLTSDSFKTGGGEGR